MSNLIIKRDLSEKIMEVIKLYHQEFGGSEFEAQNLITYMVDLSKSFGGYIDDELVTLICVSTKKVIDIDNKEYALANVCSVITKPDFRHKGYMKELLNYAENILVNEYDTVVIQAKNWDIYKDFDLIDTTIKHEYEYIDGIYPVPLLMTWEDPNIGLIRGIESTTDNNKWGVLNDDSYLQAKTDIFFESGCKFLANPFAYLWVDKNKKMIDASYNDLSQLTWLLHIVKPKDTFLLFEDEIPKDVTFLKSTNKKVVVTKTFAKSKKKFDNLKLVDFLV